LHKPLFEQISGSEYLSLHIVYELILEQSSNSNPSLQEHFPFLQIPFFEQSFGHFFVSNTYKLQSGPLNPFSQKHSPVIQIPF